jgi:dCTP deaminase
MSVLTNTYIKQCLDREKIKITPFRKEALNSSGYDVHLGKNIYLADYQTKIDLKQPSDRFFALHEIPEEGFLLYPAMLILGVTVEHFQADNHLMMYEGKSSLGRLGVESHICAGAGDVGFEGHWTLEIRCMFPTRIYAGMPIGQVMFFQTIMAADEGGYKAKGSYNNAFQEDPKPILSNYHTKTFI